MSSGLRTMMRWIAALFGAVTALGAPWLSLGIRLWLAQAFVVAGVEQMMMGHAPTAAASGMPGVMLDVTGSLPGMIVQAVCPPLLAAGLLTRPVALALLLQAVLLALPGAPPDAARFIVVLLIGLGVAGAGPLSLDHLLKRGLSSSAVPGAAAIGRGFAWLSDRGGPVWLLGLRVWLAAAPAGLALAELGVTPASFGVLPWLPVQPSMVAMLPSWLGLLLAALLAIGLFGRLAALALLLLVPVAGLAGGDIRLYWALLLAIPVVFGPGRLAVDAWIGRRLMRAAPAPDDADWPHVVVIGGGFGGLAAVRGLAGAPCRITLIDQRNHTLFQPLLYQVATAGLAPGDIATPIRGLFREQANVRVLLDRVTGVDSAARAVILDRRRVVYDYLVLATGARHSYFGRDDWAPFAPGLKSVEDATDIRRRLLLAFEEAENAPADADRAAWLTFIIVGGGPTGVELAGAIAELARHGMAREFRTFDPASARIILVQSGPRVLPTFPETLSTAAADGLRALGVELLLDKKVTSVTAAHVEVSGDLIETRTVLWAAGVMASAAAAWLGVAADRAGRVPVGPDLSVTGHDGVFAIGDTAASLGWAGQPVPGLAPAAKQGGVYVARVIRRRIEGRRAPGPFRYRHLGSLATVGRKSAVADFGVVRLRGPVAWWLWGAVHIAFLAGGRNRASVIVEWLWAYLTFQRGTRLITEPAAGLDG
jgi:NADH dehydrogenase/putative oxidoreductase